MSKWLPEDKLNDITARIEKVRSMRNQLTPEQIEEVSPLFKEHFGEQLDKPLAERVLFQDKWGGTIMYIKFPKKPKELKPKNTSGTYLIYPISPTLESTLKSFIEHVDGIWEKQAIIRGKITVQYKTIGSDGYPLNLPKFLKTYEGATKLEEIDPTDYYKSYVFNIWQGLAVIN